MAGISSTGAIILDPAQVKDLHISGTPADAIQYSKVRPWRHCGTDFGVVIGGIPSAAERIVFVADGPGTILGFHAKLHAAGASTAITFDCKVNNASVATSVITINNSTAKADGTISGGGAFLAGDEISIPMAGTFTGAQGPYAWVSIALTNAPTI